MAQVMRSGIVSVARRKASSSNGTERPLVTLPRGHDSYVLLDGHAFRNAMNVLIARATTPFTVLVIRPLASGATLHLADLLVRHLRAPTGDLAGYMEAAIAVALQDTKRQGALAFSERLRDAWHRTGRGELLIELAEYPREEQRAIELLTTDWSPEAWMPLVIDEGGPPRDQPRP